MTQEMGTISRTTFIALSTSFCGCAHGELPPTDTVEIPAGPSWSGSTLDARASAVAFLAQGDGPKTVRAFRQLRAEAEPVSVPVDGFHIMAHPVTQAEYSVFTKATGAPEPWVDAARWDSQGTGFPYAATERFSWIDGEPDATRRHHPVVLVDRHDAQGYCSWWGRQHGGVGALPTEAQWNRAAAGDEGSIFPWGDTFDATLANTWETGVGDTVAVGASPESASPFGVHDLAGNVFEWTRTRTGATHSVLKGGSWSAGLVDARTSARQSAPDDLRHITVGFRCVYEPSARFEPSNAG